MSKLRSSSIIILGLLWVVVTQGQRGKEGCFENSVPSCDHPSPPLDPSIDTHTICTILQEEFLPPVDYGASDFGDMYDLSSHQDHLNEIEANTPFCEQVRQAYHQCLWCAKEGTDIYEWWGCYNWNECRGARPEDVPPEIDIEATCSQLEEVNKDGPGGINSLDLCERERQVYHLCPQFCDEYQPLVYCFNETHPPSCEEYRGPINETLDVSLVCEEISWEATFSLAYLGFNLMLNQSYQIEHFREWWTLYDGDPECDNIRQAWSQCHWCTGEYCFTPDDPPSCTAEYTGPVNDTLDTELICEELGRGLPSYDHPEIIFDIPQHLEYMTVIPGNSTLCHEARQAYSKCTWCSQDDLCFNKANPPTCDAPLQLDGVDPNWDVNEMCQEIYYLFPFVQFDDEYWNVSTHTPYLWSIGANTTTCSEARAAYHQCNWCAENVPQSFCAFDTCDPPDTIPEGFDLNGTCEEINNTYPYTIEFCTRAEIAAHHCPDLLDCGNSNNANWKGKEIPKYKDQDYLGADTNAKKKALVWASRTAAFLSFFGSSFILFDILRNSKARKCVYHQLIIGMAFFDIMTAFGWVFATAAIDKDDVDYVYGVVGTEKTCKAQAFFIQLGFTSIFYNVSLALYYMLVIVYDWREHQLKKINLYLHFLPLICGLGLACGALPFYHWIEYGCHLLPPPEGQMWSVLVFVVVPLGLSIVCITASMLVVYCKVRRQAAKSRKWAFGVGANNTLEREVFWQCFWYVLAFYVSWPILFSVYLASVDVGGPFGLTLTVAFVAPLQGFNNFLVFIRPKIKNYLKERNGTSQASRERRGFGAVFRQLFSSATTRVSFMTSSRVPSGMSEVLEMDMSGTSTSNNAGNAGRGGYTMDPSALISLRKLPIRLDHDKEDDDGDDKLEGDGALSMIEETLGGGGSSEAFVNKMHNGDKTSAPDSSMVSENSFFEEVGNGTSSRGLTSAENDDKPPVISPNDVTPSDDKVQAQNESLASAHREEAALSCSDADVNDNNDEEEDARIPDNLPEEPSEVSLTSNNELLMGVETLSQLKGTNDMSTEIVDVRTDEDYFYFT